MPEFLQTSDGFVVNVGEIHSAKVNDDGSILLGVHGVEKQTVRGEYADKLCGVLGIKTMTARAKEKAEAEEAKHAKADDKHHGKHK